MQRLVVSLLVLFGAVSCGTQTTPDEFTRQMAERIRSSRSAPQVKVSGSLELRIGHASGDDQRAYLDNAYREYLESDPAKREEVLNRYVRAYLESLVEIPVERAQIVPVVKSAAWLAEMRRMFATEGKPFESLHEALNDDLVVFYVQGTPSNIRYLKDADLEALGIERRGLRELAVANLEQVLPQVEITRGDLVNMVTAGGSYEASLLLFADLWEGERRRLRGDLLVAVPARDLLLFADSADADAVARLRELAAKAAAEASYAVTDRLFVLWASGIQPFDELHE